MPFYKGMNQVYRSRLRQQHDNITAAQLFALFHKPARIAALELGLRSTSFKKMCRRRGIQRWPHRSYQSLQKTIETLENMLPVLSVAEQCRISQQLCKLRRTRDRVIQIPSSVPSKMSLSRILC